MHDVLEIVREKYQLQVTVIFAMKCKEDFFS